MQSTSAFYLLTACTLRVMLYDYAMQNQFLLTPFFLDQPREFESLAQDDWLVNNPSLTEQDVQNRMSQIHESLAQHIAQTIRNGARPISVMGDCCGTIGVVAGLQRAGQDFVLLWLDAHGDFNTWETTPSGFLGGMPLAMLVGRGEQTMPRAVNLQTVDEARVVLSDARDLDPGEKIYLQNSRVHHISDARELLNSKVLNAPLYIHFDTDLVNPIDAPAQSYATAGGPMANELREIFRALAQSKNIVAVSMCAWNPQLDTDGKTRVVSMELLRTLIS